MTQLTERERPIAQCTYTAPGEEAVFFPPPPPPAPASWEGSAAAAAAAVTFLGYKPSSMKRTAAGKWPSMSSSSSSSISMLRCLKALASASLAQPSNENLMTESTWVMLAS